MQIIPFLFPYAIIYMRGMRQFQKPAGMRCLCDGISGHTSEASFPGGRSSSVYSELLHT